MIDGAKTAQTKKKSLTIANFDFSDEIDDLNNLDFKPINKGLGFHREEKSIPKKMASTLTPISARNQPRPELNTLEKEYIAERPVELAAFYNSKLEEPSVNRINETVIQKNIIEEQPAPVLLQMTAWLIDTVFVFIVLVLTLSVLSFVSGIELSYFGEMVSRPEISIYMAGLFCIYYLLYFTILDLAGTIGKSMMGIKLTTVNNKPLRVRHTFVRAFISLTSFLAVGLPLVMDFQGRLSETKVVR